MSPSAPTAIEGPSHVQSDVPLVNNDDNNHYLYCQQGDLPARKVGPQGRGLLKKLDSLPFVIEKKRHGVGEMRMELWKTSKRYAYGYHYRVTWQVSRRALDTDIFVDIFDKILDGYTDPSVLTQVGFKVRSDDDLGAVDELLSDIFDDKALELPNEAPPVTLSG